MSETTNAVATAASEEEKKRGLQEAIRKFFEALKYFFTHTSKGALIEQMKQMQEQIEESIAQNEINADTIDELCEVFKELNGSLDTLTPDKVDELMDDLQQTVNDILGKNFIGVSKESMLSEDINKHLKSCGIKLEKDFEDRIRVIDNDKTDNKLYVEIDGHILEATYDKSAKKVNIDTSSKKYEEVFKEDGSLQDGFEFVEAKTGNAEHDMMFSFAEKNGMKYAFDKEQTKKDIEAQLSPKGLWLQSRMSSVKLSEDGRYESHYFASENSFRIRDTKTNDLLDIKTEKGKIEIFASKDAKNVEDIRSPQKVGQWSEENGKLQNRFVFPSPNIAMMFHCEEMKQWLEHNGISRENQKEGLRQEKDIQWSKVQDAHRSKVYDLKDACIDRAEKEDGEFSIKVSRKTDKFTFLTITKQEGKDNLNPTISIAFDEQGNPKTLNSRTENGKFAFMQNLRSHNVAESMYKLRSDQSFSQVYNIVTDVLKDMGIDSKCRFEKPKKATTKTAPAPKSFIPFNERGISGDINQYNAERMFADMMNKVAVHALNNTGKIDRHTVYNLGIRNDADTILKELAKMNVLKKVGTRYEKATTPEIYANKMLELAKSPELRKDYMINGHIESYSAFLIDSYQKHREAEKANALERLSEALTQRERENVMRLLVELSSDAPAIVDASYVHKALNCQYNEAVKLNNVLRQIGVIENNAVALDEDKMKTMFEAIKEQNRTPIELMSDKSINIVEDYLEGMYSFPTDNIPSIIAELEDKGIENAENIVTSIRNYMIENEIISKDSSTVNTEKLPDGEFPEKLLSKIRNGELDLNAPVKEVVELTKDIKEKEKKQEGFEH